MRTRRAALTKLAGQPQDSKLAASIADAFMFQEYYRDRAPEQLAKEFGPQFALAVAKLEPGSWQGPVQSGLGWHLVFIDTAVPGRVPAFEEVEAEVKAAWLGEQKVLAWQKAYNEMRAKYTVLLPGRARSRRERAVHVVVDEACAVSDRPCVDRPAGRVAAARVTAFCLSLAQAHESRPAYLEIKETAPGQYAVLWRTPVLAGMRLPVVLQLPADVRNLREPLVQELSDSVIERRLLDAGPNGLAGKRIEFPGLQFTITDVLVRTQELDGTHSTELVRPGRPWIEFAAPRSTAATAGVFLAQGVEHILFGVDHLLFVLGLLLLVRSPWMLVKTITAFTIAHSITLALATLGIVNVPRPPLEAAIALSILFLGVEVVRAWRGESSFTIRNPWVVAFAFGLLHGFGFASGLAKIGLPHGDIPLALLMFNLGVEVGQLAFVAVMILLWKAIRRLVPNLPRVVPLLPAYLVGTLGAFWTIERVAQMASG